MSALTTFSDAYSQDIETLVMPGEVIAGHAELEPECSSCHKLFDKKGQTNLCMDCHEDVAADVNGQKGYHGLANEVLDEACSSCHTDHQGRGADIVLLDDTAFEHEFTDFELIGAHLEIECDDCHSSDEKHREATSDCSDCHKDDDIHREFMGADCGACHSSTEWKDATFDHDETDYPLLGKHLETACLDCHEDETYQNAPSTCFGCHAEDDSHNGRSGDNCGNCHNPTDWNDSSFDHGRDTNFVLVGEHAQLTCDDCHSENPFEDQMDAECSSCHLEDDHHAGHRGADCGACHASEAWAEPIFDHDRDTEYTLRGGHQDVACNDCHIEPIFEVALTTSCDSCHLEDDAHEGSLGSECASCHTEVNWQDPVFFDHDLTSFPLLGKHADNECDDCHESQAFKDTDATCTACHADDDPHRGNFPKACESCHNPVAWDQWLFDHDIQTAFPLAGAHVEIACADCHRSPLDKMKGVGGNCGSCHKSDDVHDSEFGFDCGRCHSDDSFKNVRSLQ